MSYGHFSTECHEHHAIVSDVQAEVITLCGSMQFFPRMLTVAAELTSAGAIVLAPFCVVAPEDQRGWNKAALDELHRDKIRLATARIVVVSDESGYFGDSTRAEIEFAESLGLAVAFRRVEREAETGPTPELPSLETTSRCRSCSAPIAWRRTVKGGRIPLDPAPAATGNVTVVDGGRGVALVLNDDEIAEIAERPDVPRYVSHFATCPDADTWRSKGES